MNERFMKRVLVERTRAEVTFADGRTETFASEWGDSQQGRGYDGGNWGPFPEFRNQVENKVKEAQKLWSLPSATIRYFRESRTTETIERAYEVSKFYSERTVGTQ